MNRRSMNSYMRSPRRVTVAAIGMPVRRRKAAIDFLARRMAARWPVILPSSSAAASSSLMFWLASPNPMFTTTFESFGTAMGFLNPKRFIASSSARIAAGDSGSYTAKLHARGLPKMAQKVGEEGLEVALAAVVGFIDVLRTPAQAFPAVERQTRVFWLVILALAAALMVVGFSALNLLGLHGGHTRLPYVDADEHETAVIRAMLETRGLVGATA